MPPKIAKFAALGAYGACAGMLGLFAVLIYFTRQTPQGGIMSGLSWVTWISFAVVFASLIGAHAVIGRQLMHIGKGGGPTEA